ncbi:MAG: hypothetical protein M5T52_04255 [Ignavibacteriaceae bacterium]|nr:hypothetical protein [Ignavibacteriaceae bacterium]
MSGAVGDIVFRERFGVNYVGLRPDSFVPGNDPASVARRQRFSLATKTGVTINSVSPLKSLWQPSTPSGMSPYNYIVKTNYRYVTSSTISDLLKIVPENGFGVTVADSVIDRTRVRLIVEPIGTNAGIDVLQEPNIISACVLFLSAPVDESVGAYSILSAVSEPIPTDLTQQLTLDANLTNQQQTIFDKYQTRKVFAALVTLDANGIPVHYSSTILLS